MQQMIRAEQVGSLLRPPAVLEARSEYSQGRLPIRALRGVEDRAIREAIERQRALGLDILTDGEIRRASWLTDMAEAVEGFVSTPITVEWKGPGGRSEASSAKAVAGKLRKTRKLTSEELPLLQEMAQGRFKVTVPAPSNFALTSYIPGITEPFYPALQDLMDDLIEIVRDEIRWLVAQGVTYIQLDAPFYSYYLDPEQRAAMKARGADPDVQLAAAIAADNAALSGISSASVTSAMHVCRGNHTGRWYTRGAYDAIAEQLFGSLNVDRFLLEYDDERSGGFEPLRLVPKGKVVVLGLITTKHGKLESSEDLCRRIDEAARIVLLDHLALSPQCGFASVAAGNPLSAEEQWRKLALVAETARKVWSA